jgi:hypothetical protein
MSKSTPIIESNILEGSNTKISTASMLSTMMSTVHTIIRIILILDYLTLIRIIRIIVWTVDIIVLSILAVLIFVFEPSRIFDSIIGVLLDIIEFILDFLIDSKDLFRYVLLSWHVLNLLFLFLALISFNSKLPL